MLVLLDNFLNVVGRKVQRNFLEKRSYHSSYLISSDLILSDLILSELGANLVCVAATNQDEVCRAISFSLVAATANSVASLSLDKMRSDEIR